MSDRKIERWIKENVEAIAIAVVMALVIRQFAIEAFKIPTESMYPTLLGDAKGGGTGDRILVYKVPYLLGEPSRWDVVVFKYPLNESKNYIKRLVGLPGEEFRILDGDVIVDGKIARKPRHVQEEMYLPEYPANLGQNARQKAWPMPDETWRRSDNEGFLVTSPDGQSLCRYSRRMPQNHGGDVRLSLTVTGKQGEVLLRIDENGVPMTLALAVGKGESRVEAKGVNHPLPDIVLPVDEPVEVVFENVDDSLLVSVDGEEFRVEYESIAREIGDDDIRFGVKNGIATFENIRVDRDVHYGSNQGVSYQKIPEDHFFVLGDNTGNSQDSRRWRLQQMTMKDGTVHEYDRDQKVDDRSQMPERERGYEVFMDRKGIWRKVNRSDIEREGSRNAPLVSRSQMIGKAFFVFWPMNPFNDQFRLKFIR